MNIFCVGVGGANAVPSPSGTFPHLGRCALKICELRNRFELELLGEKIECCLCAFYFAE